MNSENTGRLLDKGPSPKAEDAEAWRKADLVRSEDFRLRLSGELWGPKSELRRFKDGTMLECCVWNGADDESVEGQIIVRCGMCCMDRGG